MDAPVDVHNGDMLRHTAALLLWAYFGWYLAATLADLLGLPMALGPIGGVIVGAIAMRDWRGQSPARSASHHLVPHGERS